MHNVSRNHGCPHWTDTPEQRATAQERARAEKEHIAAAEASGLTSDGLKLEKVLARPSDIPYCSDYTTVTVVPASFTLFTSWRERQGDGSLKEVRVYR